jgi:hypothetical protein
MANDLAQFFAGDDNPEYAASRILSFVGSKSASRIGSGQKGIAYAISGGRVLKLTTDKSEANAMALVESNPSPYIVHVDDVFQVGPKLTSSKNIYGIVQEKLSSPSGDWARFVNLIDSAVLQQGGGITAKKVLAFNDELEAERDVDSDYLPEFTEEKVEWLFGIAQYFDSVGIKFFDFHAGNIMKSRSGRHVMIDLGVSRSPAVSIRVQESQMSQAALVIDWSCRRVAL